MRHQRIFIVDDRDRAVRVLDQAGTHRTEQAAECAVAAATHHDQFGPLRQVDKSGNGGRVVHLALDLHRAHRGLIDDPDCFVEALAALLLLPFSEARWQRCLGQGRNDTADDMDQAERCAAHRSIACGPIDGNLRGG